MRYDFFIARGALPAYGPAVGKSKTAFRPKSWANWRAHRDGVPYKCGEERLLYSDAEVRGSLDELGPYMVQNLCGGSRPDDEAARPVVALRVAFHTNANPEREDLAHGASMGDEIAALLALILRIRLRAGDRTRTFKSPSEPGEARFESAVERPYLLPGHWSPVIAVRDKRVDLDDALPLLRTFPLLEREDASALVSAARLYQDALWFSEREPRQSWLRFVSAAEAIATLAYRKTKFDDEGVMRELWPDVAAALDAAGENAELRATVAARVAQLAGSTMKFRRLFAEHLAAPPSVRPRDNCLEWSVDALAPMLTTVYDLRSSDLHAGRAFPKFLCMAPPPEGDTFAEVLDEYEREDVAGEIKVPAREVPMRLHVFEYLVHGAILGWWRARAQPTST